MKVGDLVRTTYKGLPPCIGIIVEVEIDSDDCVTYHTLLCDGEVAEYSHHGLEVINESR